MTTPAGTDFTIKRNDTLPPLEAVLRGPDAEALNLTGTTVTFIMRTAPDGRGGQTSKVIDSPAVIIGAATNGIVQYQWKAGDTAVEGTYDGEFEIRYPDNKKRTVPTDSYIVIVVTPDLDQE